MFYDRKTPIFVFGTHRSGTTLLQRILNSAHGVTIWGEQGHSLGKIAEAYFLRLDIRNNTLRKHEVPYFILLQETIKNPRKWCAWANWYGIHKYRENYRKFIRSFFAPPFLRVKHWGFKEIRYGRDDRVLEFLHDIYPKARFIFLIRNSIDCIASRIATPYSRVLAGKTNKNSFLETNIEKWNKQNRTYYEFYQSNKQISFIIRYEDITTKNYSELKRLFRFLNIRFSNKQVEVIELKEGRGSSPKEIKETILDPEDRQRIAEQTKEVRDLFGYV